jgi:thymidylate synthase (FAD)
LEFRSDVTVELIQHAGNDAMIAAAAWVSTKAELSIPSTDDYEGWEKIGGLINYLMKNRHGTPFEHGMMTFFVQAPIFVFREFHRHRIGWSYNEESGRYRKLRPIFYVPDKDRALIQTGKPGHYEYIKGEPIQWQLTAEHIQQNCKRAYEHYELLLDNNVAKEVARSVLPVNIFSSMYATCNPRSLMSFLSLRTKAEHSKFPSYPQREIEMVAEKMEWEFSLLFPKTFEAFDQHGRVSP